MPGLLASQSCWCLFPVMPGDATCSCCHGFCDAMSQAPLILQTFGSQAPLLASAAGHNPPESRPRPPCFPECQLSTLGGPHPFLREQPPLPARTPPPCVPSASLIELAQAGASLPPAPPALPNVPLLSLLQSQRHRRPHSPRIGRPHNPNFCLPSASPGPPPTKLYSLLPAALFLPESGHGVSEPRGCSHLCGSQGPRSSGPARGLPPSLRA